MPDTISLPLLARSPWLYPPQLTPRLYPRTRDVQYHVVIYDPGSSFGPGTAVAELTPEVVNLGWQQAQNLPGMAVFTMVRPSEKLGLIQDMRTHVKIWREDQYGVWPIFAGRIAKTMPRIEDTVVVCWDYKALLQLSRTPYEVLYPDKKIGTEIVSPQWTAAHDVMSSPLGFVATGTIENPVGTNGTTEITVGEDFGLTFMNRLFVFYMLAEMAMANTSNNVVFDISTGEPHTFSFLKDKGYVINGLDFTCPGNVISFDLDKGADRIRNDRATVIQGTDGDEEYTVTDPTSITTYGRLQDAVSPRTLVGETTGTTETDQTKAIMARLLEEGTRTPKALLMQIRQNEFCPTRDIDLGDKVRVTLAGEEGALLLDQQVRVTAFSCAWTPGGGELLQVQARGVDG